MTAVREPIPQVADIWPARRLREELAEARRAGRTFDDVWQFALLRVGREVWMDANPLDAAREREEWIEVFRSLERVWRAAYDRRDGVPDLVGLLRD